VAAAAISLFGFEPGAALATVVGVLIELPLMRLVVRWLNGTRDWYERGRRSWARQVVAHCYGGRAARHGCVQFPLALPSRP
jgi:hypothetical protein